MSRPGRERRAYSLWIVLAVSVAAFTTRAGADSIREETPHPPPKNRQVTAKPAGLDPPRVALSVDPVDEGGWVVRIDNQDSVPVRIVEDWRLFSLDVTPPPTGRGKLVVQHCVLPTDMRPTEDLSHPLVLGSGKSYVNFIDPRILCFSGAQGRALVPGATVVAHFGFSPDSKNPSGPPLVAIADDPSASRSPSKELLSDPFVVPEYPARQVSAEADGGSVDSATSTVIGSNTTSSGSAGPSALSDESDTSGLAVTTAPRIDTDNIRDLVLRITLTNRSPRTVTMLLSPHTVAIDVTNHFGTTFPCQWEHPPTPIRDLFISIPPKGHATTEVLVQDMCPPSFLAFPGLYILRASVDTRRVSGASLGLRTFVGRVEAAETSLVRIHSLMRGWVRQ